MLCGKCATDLPEGSLFCLKCGQPVPEPVISAEPPIIDAILGCSKCGANLPDGAQFCPRCGKPVSSPPKSTAASHSTSSTSQGDATRPRRKRRVVLWILLGLFVLLVIWLASSDNPVAQAAQESVGFKHDRTILDSPFTVGPHTFRYYKFVLPEGSVNVAIVGQFGVMAETPEGRNQKTKDKTPDNDIEVYVLTESAFTIWQNGYDTSSLYDSGRISQGAIQGDLPAGEGIYYLVFSNKFAPKTPKNVRANVVLRYKSWLPDWVRRTKDTVWNWFGL